MKITIDGNIYINSHDPYGTQDVRIRGEVGTYIDLEFEVNAEKHVLRLKRSDLDKVLRILDEDLM